MTLVVYAESCKLILLYITLTLGVNVTVLVGVTVLVILGVVVGEISQLKLASKLILACVVFVGVGVTQYPEYMIEDSKSGTSKKHGDLPVIMQLPPKV